jgi:hypothetical protein
MTDVNFSVLSELVFNGASGGVGSRPDALGVEFCDVVSWVGMVGVNYGGFHTPIQAFRYPSPSTFPLSTSARQPS